MGSTAKFSQAKCTLRPEGHRVRDAEIQRVCCAHRLREAVLALITSMDAPNLGKGATCDDTAGNRP